MGHWRKQHESDSNNLKSADLYDEKRSAEKGRPVYFSPIVTIEKMSAQKVKSKEKPRGEMRNFAHFKGHKKPLGLNVTACEMLTMLSGSPDVDRWPGLKIQLYVDTVRYPSGQMGPAIRIRNEVPDGAPSPPPPELSPEKREQLEREHAERVGEREPGQEG